MRAFILSCGVLFATAPAFAGTFFNAATPANNADTLAAFRVAAGMPVPSFSENFEGIDVGTNISGQLGFIPAMRLTSSNGTATITTGSGSIGGSNPIDLRAVEMAESATITLAFAFAMDSFGGFSIDQGGMTMTVGYVGGGTEVHEVGDTNASGNSAEFFGFVQDAGGPGIISVAFSSVSGSANWGLDNLEYNLAPIPEPATMVALGLGAVAVLRRRRK